MPSVTRRRTHNRAERRDEIGRRLMGAVHEMLDDGASFTELSVERLVKEADLSRSTFYVYFEDKGDLLRALAAGVMDDIIGATRVWFELPPTATQDDLRDALREIVEAYRPHESLMGAVIEASAYDPNVREQFNELMDRAADAVASHIREGQEDGYVRAELDPQPTARWISWMAERGFYQLIQPADDAEAERLLSALTAIVWNALYEGTR